MAQMLSNLPIGATVKFGKHSISGEVAQPISWIVADKNHSGYPTGTITLIAEHVIDLRAFDGSEAKADGWGNQYFAISNLHQWLNSSASAGAWYTPAHDKDAPPNSTNVSNKTNYDVLPGFLFNFSDAERNAIVPTTLNVQSESGFTSLTTKVFLPSINELGVSTTTPPGDGASILSYFSANNGIALNCAPTSQALT